MKKLIKVNGIDFNLVYKPMKTKLWYLLNSAIENRPCGRYRSSIVDTIPNGKVIELRSVMIPKLAGITTMIWNNQFYTATNEGKRKDKSGRVYQRISFQKMDDREVDQLIPEIKNCPRSKEGNCEVTLEDVE